MERLASRATSCVLASGPVLIFLLVSKAMTLIPVSKSLPAPPREGIAGANAVFEDADDFQARFAAFGAFSPGILPFWACCRLLLGQRTLQLHGNSLSPHFYWRDGLRSLIVRVQLSLSVAACKKGTQKSSKNS